MITKYDLEYHREKNRIYREKNREKLRAARREYYKRNREKELTWQKKHYMEKAFGKGAKRV